ncbi:major facilitator superfamily domain-containing protein [Mycena maculata]|uniref:Major facilitator superfamily domain-containing protein n=1 Tax=Mycena maculata TaxID=230809 RepID=A0AAD7HZ07_9AGAR|nr:major facilitator superfamily domain-containing protein [Mycena maculata]
MAREGRYSVAAADVGEKIPPVLELEKAEREIPQEAEFPDPDGGLRAWGTVFGAFMINFSCYGVITSFGVFEQHYSVNQLKDEPLSTISWIGSLQLSLVLLMGCVSGPLFDAGYLKPMIASAGALYVFCLLMTSISTEFYQFVLSQGLGVGIAMGFLFSPSMSTIGHHFKKHKILAFGIFASGASVGGTVVPIAMRRLFDEVGFPWAVRTLAFLVLFCMICGFVCCSSHLPPRRGGRVIDFRVFEDRAYCFLVLGAALVGMGLYAPVSYGVTYAVAHGVTQDLAFYSLSILNAFSLFGRILPNIVAQRVGPLNILVAACGLAGVLDFVWVVPRSTTGILVFNAAFGFASGGYVSVLPAAISTLSVNPQNIGLRLGMAFFCTSFFWLAGAPMQGALINLHGTYWPAAVFSGSTVLAGVALMGAARGLVGRRTGRWWV